jgi:crotonobetainyl-CoA:carnitine CoA-transferase CaiB-like acyl-CoA transferase
MIMPLQGVRVVEWAVWMSGPMAATCLGDLGADVIKVEQTGAGDALRGLWSQGEWALPDGRHALFEAYNRNKRSIAIDLKKEKGREIAYQLVKWADVFVHNFPRDTASKLGLDYQTLCQINPRLIYATASSYGRKGPDKDMRSYDLAGMARSGLMAALADLGGGEPQSGVNGIADQIAAFTLSHGILAALVARERMGIGQEIDASLLGSMIYLQHFAVSFSLFFDKQHAILPRSKANNPMFNWYKCKDDKWIALIMLQPDPYWPGLCRALNIVELEKDRRFADVFKRQDNAAELISILEKVFTAKTREEWMEILKSSDLPYCPINSMLDLPSDPQVVENGYIVNFNHPSLGTVKLTGFPVWFSKTPAAVKREAPQFGQHTEEVLQEVLGLGWEKIGQLKSEGVI